MRKLAQWQILDRWKPGLPNRALSQLCFTSWKHTLEGSSFLFSLSPQLLGSVVWACGGPVPWGESMWQKWTLHLTVDEKQRERDEEVRVEISPLKAAPVQSHFLSINPSLKGSTPPDKCYTLMIKLYTFTTQTITEKKMFSLWPASLKCNHPDCLSCRVISGNKGERFL